MSEPELQIIIKNIEDELEKQEQEWDTTEVLRKLDIIHGKRIGLQFALNELKRFDGGVK